MEELPASPKRGREDLSSYRDVRWTHNSAEGFRYAIAEVPLKNRIHRRAIAFDQSHSSTYGRCLLYSDSYLGGEQSETFVYARHKCSPRQFFEKLNVFLDAIVNENPELRGRKYPMLSSIGGKARIAESPIPVTVDLEIVDSITFFRLDLPFGANTVEFTINPVAFNNIQGDSLLPRQVDTPLAGFDFTESTLFQPLLLDVHWAAELVPHSLLEAALGEISYQPIMA
jgi:hypothetical protein